MTGGDEERVGGEGGSGGTEAPPPAGGGGAGGRGLARPRVVPMRWPFPVVWVVPVLAAIAAGVYLYEHHKDRGREIVIAFPDATGVRAEETWVEMRGAQVGIVTGVVIGADHRHADVHVRLHGEDDSIGKEGARFWIVKPTVSQGGVSGLGTIVSGAYIEARPGEGAAKQRFAGTEQAPLVSGAGLRVILHTDRLSKLEAGSAVMYRGLPVGVVQDIRLSEDSAQVNVTAFIRERYVPLVRTNTRFWLISGAEVHGGLFTGVKAKLGSVQEILSGGIGMATPDEAGAQVGDGERFELEPEGKQEWLKWEPRIVLPEEGD